MKCKSKKGKKGYMDGGMVSPRKSMAMGFQMAAMLISTEPIFLPKVLVKLCKVPWWYANLKA